MHRVKVRFGEGQIAIVPEDPQSVVGLGLGDGERMSGAIAAGVSR
jgi:hypothetical protein